jgi:hypothetical protein
MASHDDPAKLHTFSLYHGSPPPLPADGITYLFVSNSDNLGATLDLDLLAYFADTDKAFIMEVGTGFGSVHRALWFQWP